MANHRQDDEQDEQPAPDFRAVLTHPAVVTVGVVLVVVALLVGVHAIYSAATSTIASTLTPAQQQGTPLGCPENGDGQCVDRTLAHDLCDIDLDPDLPPTYQAGDPASIEITRWDNNSVGLSVVSEFTQGVVSWQCTNRPENLFHIFSFSHQHWRDLHTDGAPMPPELDGLIPLTK